MNIKNKISIPEIIVLCFLITFFCVKTISMPHMISNGLIAFSGVTCFGYAMLKRKVSLWQFLLAIGLSILMLMSIIFNGNSSILEILWIWCYFGVAIMLKNFSIDSKKISCLLLVITLVYGIKILSGMTAASAIGGDSGNSIATYILFYAFLIYIKRYEEGKNVIYWPCIIAIALSIWGNGRAGLLASIIMFILIFVYDYKCVTKEKKTLLKKVIALIICAILIISVFLRPYIETFFIKFYNYGYSSVRTKIYLEYIINSFKSIGNFMFGVPMISDNTPLLTTYSANPHNAFLMLHAKYGIIGFSYVLLMLIRFVIKHFKEKKYLYLIVFIVWFVRSMFDWTGFPGIFDVLFFYFLLSSCNENKIQISSGIKKIYSFFITKIYKISSKKTIIKISEIFNTNKMTKYHHIVSALRYVAIEEYYGENDFGMDFYIRANQWENKKHLEKDLERFKSLIKSIEINGYDMNSEIYIDLDGNCFDGTHRLALCAWFGIKKVPAAIVKRHLKIKSVQEMKEYYCLSDEDYVILEKAYQRMRERLKNKSCRLQ